MPAPDALEQFAQGVAGPRGQCPGLEHALCALDQRHAGLAGGELDLLLGLVAEPPLGDVDDPLEREPVVGRDGEAEIGHRVPDLAPLVEAGAADHPVGHADGQEAVLEGAHLEAGAHQDRDVVEPDPIMAAGSALEGLDLLADPAGFLLPVPVADQAHPLAGGGLGPQGLAQTRLVGVDHARGGGEDMGGRAIVLLQPDHLGAGKILLEAQDVADLGAAPAVD